MLIVNTKNREGGDNTTVLFTPADGYTAYTHAQRKKKTNIAYTLVSHFVRKKKDSTTKKKKDEKKIYIYE